MKKFYLNMKEVKFFYIQKDVCFVYIRLKHEKIFY